MRIDFVCVGTQRSGTTWLHRCLSEHDQLVLPHKKELGVFLEPDLVVRDVTSVLATEFPKSDNPNVLYGEINPTYYLHPGSLLRLQAHNPDAKIVFCVREPISKAQSERAYFTGRYGKGFFTKTAYKDLYANYRHMHYASVLRHLYDLFGEPNVLVIVYEALKADPAGTLQSLENFLGVTHRA